MGISLYGLTPATTYDALIKTGDNEPLTASLKVLSDGVGTNLPMEASTTGINFTGSLLQGGVAVPTAGQVAAKQDTLVSGTNIKTVNSTTILGSGNLAVQDVLVSGTNIKTINGTSVLGSGNIVTPSTPPSGVSGAIQFSNGSAFASDAANFFWDNTNKRLGVGTNAPTSPLQVAGTITTQNLLSSGVIYGGSFWLQDNGTMALGQQSAGAGKLTIKGSGSTSATTSLLVQNSGGTASLTVRDNNTILTGGIGVGSGGNLGQVNFNLSADFTVSTPTNVNFKNGYTDTSLFFMSAVGDSIGIKNTSPNASAIFDIASTTKGFLPPRMTTTQKNAIASPAAGLVLYDSTTNKLQCYNGSTWNDLF
jgi:hypothetical protein